MTAIQTDITSNIRAIVVDWLWSVHKSLDSPESVMWLTMNIFDRYLSIIDTHRKILQLVAIAAYFIASKLSDNDIGTNTLTLSDACRLTDNAFNITQLKNFEYKILKTLNFHIQIPTVYNFLMYYINITYSIDNIRDNNKIDNYSANNYITLWRSQQNLNSCFSESSLLKSLACYYADRNLLEYDLIEMTSGSSALYAACCIYCARVQQSQYNTNNLPINTWPKQLEDETGYKINDLILISKIIIIHVKEECQSSITNKRQLIIKKKYSDEKYHYVAKLPLPSI